MDPREAAIGGNEYAYRPLTTKHRRAGSTGTTGDEEYTTDEDELYVDEPDCSASSIHSSHPIMKSDLARAATDLFGYANEPEDGEEPTSLFDDDDPNFYSESSRRFGKKEKLSLARNARPSTKHRSTPSANIENGSIRPAFVEYYTELELEGTRTLNLRLEEENARISRIGKSRCFASNEREQGEIKAVPFDASTSDPREESNTSEIAVSQMNESKVAPGTSVLWDKTVAEVKEHAVAKLQEELKKAQEQLKVREEEVAQLSRFRIDVEQELEELTASLFQEAHSMVREANIRQSSAERLLEESRMKAEVLAAEVTALKTLVLTSTPARPNPHLHPQIDGGKCRSTNSDDTQQGLFAKKHRRSPSHLNLKYGRENSPPDSPVKESGASLPNESRSFDRSFEREREASRESNRETRGDWDREGVSERENMLKEPPGIELDPRVHAEFLQWKVNPCLDKNDPFLGRIFREDIDLCLDFPNAELGTKVRQAVLDGIIFIEAVSEKNKPVFPKKCALLEAPRQCYYRMRLSDQENQWHCISQICRNRIIAVCDFLNYLRYVERGLVKSSNQDIYFEITRLRKEMVLARLGLALSS